MDKETLVKRLMATFLEELEEHVQALNRDLLALEKNPPAEERADRYKALLRTAHSLKGASRSVNVGLIESTCHRLEEVLAGAREGRLEVGPELFAALFETVDAIEEAGMRLREHHDLTGSPLELLVPRLEAAVRGVGELAPVPAPPAVGEEHGRSAPYSVPAAETHAARATPAVPAVAAPSPAPVASEAPTEPAGSAASVRISADKLDALLAGSGELLVARRRVQARAEDLTALRESISHWKAEWRAVEKALGPLLKPDDHGDGRGLVLVDAGGRARPFPRRTAQALARTGQRLRQLEKELERLTAAMSGDARLLDQAAGALDTEVHRVRMIPFAQACQGLDRMVHDLAQAGGKEVELVVQGGGVELDRSVLEGLKDPLRHLVRNAVDHGAEPVDERRAAGKTARARITVAAVLRGGQVEVVVADDGRGLDLAALREQARKKRLAEPADERELARLIFLPGFSTSRLITDVSGRGVGLDVVKSRVEALHGTVDVSFLVGRGSRFTLAVPLTLTTVRALLVVAGGQTFAFVGTTVLKLVRVDPADLRSVEGRDMLALGGTPLPVASLAETLGLAARAPARPDGKAPAVVIAAGDQRMAFVADEFLAEQEVVVKSLGGRIRRARHVSGATILPSGRIALVLNAANLVRSALARAPTRALAAALAPAAAEARKRVLIAEDSVTTRTLEKSILEAAGYEVAVAPDGAVAWQLLQERGADLLVSDLEMPRMDGFALTEAVRGSKRFRELPVVLVTARETEADKARGIEVGANAYLVKSAFDQRNLLETIAQLL